MVQKVTKRDALEWLGAVGSLASITGVSLTWLKIERGVEPASVTAIAVAMLLWLTMTTFAAGALYSLYRSVATGVRWYLHVTAAMILSAIGITAIWLFSRLALNYFIPTLTSFLNWLGSI